MHNQYVYNTKSVNTCLKSLIYSIKGSLLIVKLKHKPGSDGRTDRHKVNSRVALHLEIYFTPQMY